MTRNLKLLAAAALALAAFGGFSASGAQAADEFHCSVNPCKFKVKQDGTGATGHQIFIIENVAKTESISFTCHEFSANAEFSGNTTTAITITDLQYNTCTVNGSPGVNWDWNGCDYRLTASAAGTTDVAETHLECPPGKKVQYTMPEIGCTFEIGPQTLTGAGYQSIGTTPNREITVTIKNMGNFVVTATAGCSAVMNVNQTLIGTRTTANFVLTGEPTSGGGSMADSWFL